MPRIIVSAGNHDRLFVPVTAEAASAGMKLVDQESGREVPFQASADGGRLTFIVANLAAGQSRVYELVPGAPAACKGVSLTPVGDDHVDVCIGEQFFTAYHFGQAYPRPFLYPVIGPFGASVTRHFPMKNVEGEKQDHPHHRSIYTAFGEVNGVDDWSEMKNHGRIVHQGFRGLEQGPVYAAIRADNAWVSHEGTRVMSETRDITIYS
ncbi:MAG: PmoA family protein, partial [Armatimonadota bacterium]|nr:PmoA family protein [Armatimonadota bacterium]